MKKRILGLILCLAMGMSLTACGGGDNGGQANQEASNASNTSNTSSSDSLNIAFITKSGSVYWKSMFEYVKKNAEENNAKVEHLYSINESDFNEEIQLVNDSVAKGVDGIILGAADKDALIAPVSAARAAGVPVVLVDSGIDGDDYDAFFSTNNVQAGAECAKSMCEFIGDAGEVAIINAVQGSKTTDDRAKGFKEEIEKNHPQVTVVEEFFCDGDKAKAQQQTADAIAKYPNLKGLFGASTSASIGLINGVSQSGATDKTVITFDNADEVKAGLANGSVSATAMQMPSTMAASAVQTIVDLHNGKTVKSKNVDTGVVMITKDNYANADMSAILNQ